MTYSIPLIDKLDGFERVRDKVAEILAFEGAAQVALAEAVPLDPAPWRFSVYTERSNPWDILKDGNADPLVNVWFDDLTFDPAKSNQTTRQQTSPTRINIDCYAPSVSRETEEGHAPGDESGARRVQRVIRLVRNILMHDKYCDLGLQGQGLVAKRWPESITTFRLPGEIVPVIPVASCRFTLAVDNVETIDLPEAVTLEIINIKFYHEPDGLVIAELEYGE